MQTIFKKTQFRQKLRYLIIINSKRLYLVVISNNKARNISINCIK
jgi:hypothetical protein